MGKIWLVLLIVVGLFIGTPSSFGQAERYVTVALNAGPIATNNVGQLTYQIAGTNSIEIAEGETGELITVGGAVGAGITPYATATRDGVTIGGEAASSMVPNGSPGSRGTTVAGPATFSLMVNYSGASPSPIKGLMTVRITPLTFASDKTVLVAPGMGNVEIKMESSTNLNQWVDATNGVYADDMRFFRIKLTKVN